MIFAKNIITTILLFFALVHIANAEDKDSLLISKLKRKADSLNAEFAKQTFDKKYYSLKQGRANYFQLQSNKVPEVEKDIANGISFEELVRKYSEATHIEDMFVFVNNIIHPDYNNYSYIVENLYDYDKVNPLLISSNYFKDSLKAGNNTYFKFKKYKRDRIFTITVLYFITDITSKELPNKYKSYIDYTSLFLQPNENLPHFSEDLFVKSINNFLDNIYDTINKNGTYLKTRMEIVDSLLKNDKNFTFEFNNIIETALNKRISTYSLEDIVENLISKEIAFKLKYSRKVFSFCGNDPSGWEHQNDLRRLELLLGDYVFFEYYLNNYFYNCDYNSLEYIFQNNLSKLLLASELYFNNNNSNNQTFSFNLKEYKNKIIPLYLEDYNNNLFKNMLFENILDTDLDDYNRIGYFKLLIGTFKTRYDDKLTQLEQNKLTELISKLPKYYNLTQLIKDN